MRVVMLGPPGSGKSTHARLLAEHLTVIHLSVGAALRDEVAKQSPLGERIEATVAAGELVDTADVLAILETRLVGATGSGGWVLDGAPRTLTQAEALDDWLDDLEAPVECVIALDVPDSEVRSRLLQRGRADDKPDVIAHRIQVWQHDGGAVLTWYETKRRLVRVDGVGDVADVARRVIAAVERF
ncbi:adenylate kinase [Actinomarinicola tropica]|uniref:Adenylate kinase n=2 Tax=Actinomarinicola tropica TaxID=2789776 RepID=A0A5Q2RKC1_9ACTN|nr:adenylate kinase [Actinomarinicola tropica]